MATLSLPPAPSVFKWFVAAIGSFELAAPKGRHMHGTHNKESLPWTTALTLARKGIPVFPCINRPGEDEDKRPLTKSGFKDATADPRQVHRWWSTEHPDALIGVPTGIKFVVIDVDLQHADALAWLEENRHRLPLTRTHATRSGGKHFLFAPTDKVRCSTSKLGPHVDTRGVGGYIVWWPACGLAVLHGDKIAKVPEWICEALAPPAPPPAVQVARSRAAASAPPPGLLRAQLQVLAGAKEGERNAVLYWTACRMGEAIRSGSISESEALNLLVSVGGQTGLSHQEIMRTARSGIREGIKV